MQRISESCTLALPSTELVVLYHSDLKLVTEGVSSGLDPNVVLPLPSLPPEEVRGS